MALVVFFDIGDTLAIPRRSHDGALTALKTLPFVPDVLETLRATTADGALLRLGVISNTGDETPARMRQLLTEANLLTYFDPQLLLFSSAEGMDKTEKAFFALAAQRAQTDPGRCIYVGEDEAERKVAAQAQFHTSFHALHVFHVIETMSP